MDAEIADGSLQQGRKNQGESVRFSIISDKGKRIFLYFCHVVGIGPKTDGRLHKSTDRSGFCRNWHPGPSIATQLTNVNSDRMIIDNKQSYGSNPDIKTVWDCILAYTDPSARVGQMDVVTRMTYSNTQGFVEKENCTTIHGHYIGNVFPHLIAPKEYFPMLPYSQKLYLCK